MSSLPRRIQRRKARAHADYEPRDLTYRMHVDGSGYDVLTPTRGWKRFSAKRLKAQYAMAYQLGRFPDGTRVRR